MPISPVRCDTFADSIPYNPIALSSSATTPKNVLSIVIARWLPSSAFNCSRSVANSTSGVVGRISRSASR